MDHLLLQCTLELVLIENKDENNAITFYLSSFSDANNKLRDRKNCNSFQ